MRKFGIKGVVPRQSSEGGTTTTIMLCRQGGFGSGETSYSCKLEPRTGAAGRAGRSRPGLEAVSSHVLAPPLFCFRTQARDRCDDRREHSDPKTDAEDDQSQLSHMLLAPMDERSRRDEYVGAPAPPRGFRTVQCPVH